MVADEPFDEINTIRGILNILHTKENNSHIVYYLIYTEYLINEII